MRRLDPLLLAIVVLGLGLRVAGLGWGLPNAERHYSYHPDEVLQIGATVRVDPLGGNFDPGFYNYGSFSFFITRLLWEFSEGIAPSGGQPWALAARIDWIGRLVAALLGALTLLLVFDIARQLMPGRGVRRAPTPAAGDAAAPEGDPRPRGGMLRRAARGVLLGSAAQGAAREAGGSYWRSALGCRVAGLCAAAILAVAPAHVAHSHYFTVDVPAAFWAAAVVAAALRLLDRPQVGTVVLAGACAGFAAATKYNSGLVVLAPLTALALSWRSQVASNRGAAAGGGAAEGFEAPACKGVPVGRCLLLPAIACGAAMAAAFLIGCPGVLLNTPRFLHDFLYEARHVQTGHGLVFERTLPAWLYHVVTSLRFGLGVPLLAVVLPGVVGAARRRSPADLVVAAWVVPYYLLIGTVQVKFLRYTLPLLPMLAAWGGVLCAEWLLDTRRAASRSLFASALVGIGFWTLGSAVSYDILFASADPRDRAAAAVRSAIPPRATVALTTVPWFYTPPLVPWNGGPTRPGEFEAAKAAWPYRFLPGGWSAERVERERPECFIVSDLEEQIRDGLRLEVPQTQSLIALLERDYRKEVFAPVASWPGMLGPGYPPEDWMYPAPTVTVYFRDDARSE